MIEAVAKSTATSSIGTVLAGVFAEVTGNGVSSIESYIMGKRWARLNMDASYLNKDFREALLKLDEEGKLILPSRKATINSADFLKELILSLDPTKKLVLTKNPTEARTIIEMNWKMAPCNWELAELFKRPK